MAEKVPSVVDNLGEYLKKAYGSMIAATKAANQLPSDLEFYRTLEPELGEHIDNLSERILGKANSLWTRSTPDSAQPITELDDVVDIVTLNAEAAEKASEDDQTTGENTGAGFRRVIDAVDGLLEKIDIGIEEAKGIRKPASTENKIVQSDPVVITVTGQKKVEGKLDYKLIHAQNIPRPQLTFKDKIDNSENTPFIWKIKKSQCKGATRVWSTRNRANWFTTSLTPRINGHVPHSIAHSIRCCYPNFKQAARNNNCSPESRGQ